MSDNKFIKRLKGEQTAKSVLEIKNESAKTSFANMPQGTSNAINVYSDHRGNATAVLEGTDIWKLNTSQFAMVPNAFGDGRDFTSTYTVFGSSLWVNATYTFDQPKIFTGATQWTLKLCGHSLLSSLSSTIGFSLIIKFGNTVTITKSFSVSESAFEFCKEFIVDFSESEQTAIKVANGDTMTVQLLCADATASATIYNGMTTLVAQQRRVDGGAVASDLHTFEDLEVEVAQLREDLDDLEEYVDNTFVRLDGTSIMTAPLKFRAGSMRGAVGPYLNGVSFWKLDSQGNITNIANLTDSQFLPVTTNAIDLGRSANQWKDLYLAGKGYIATINNGYDISVPAYAGTMVVADFTGVTAGQILTLDSDLKPVWQNAPTPISSLSDLSDVTITSPSNGEVLTYDGSKWVNQAAQTPIINYSIDGGNYISGSGTYAITRFSLILEKPDGSWEKPTDTTRNYTTDTDKTVNTNGFLLNQIKYYNHTTALGNGAITAMNKVYSKSASVPMSYSTNCGTTTSWTLGSWVYLVGSIGADGLFYLDTTQWWSDALPTTNDGKVYIQLGKVINSGTSSVALLQDRPIYFHDGTGIKEYIPVDRNIANWSSNVSKCITIIPQDIKLELNAGVLTLKAGSKVYVPNGAGVFDVVTIASDLSTTNTGFPAFVFYDVDNQSIRVRDITNSGTSDPQTPGTAYYDTQNNIINYYTGGGVKSQASFPLCIITGKNIGGVDTTVSIDQIFNGFGYIGSTKFVLPGVKGLIPNGRNADGTLKNTALIITEVKTHTGASTNSTVIGGVGNSGIANYNAPELSYNAELNYMIYQGNIVNIIPYTNIYSQVNGKIDSGITFKQVFHAVDYDEFNNLLTEFDSHKLIAYQAPTSGNNYTWYRKYSDGWVEQGGFVTVAAQNSGTALYTDANLPIAMADTNYSVNTVFITDGGNTTGLRNHQNERFTSVLRIWTYSTTTISNSYTMGWQVTGKAA